MCTVTLIPLGTNDFVLTSNRDEASASPYCHHQTRYGLQHPEQISISPTIAPSFDQQDGGNGSMQPASPYYRPTEDFSTARARGQRSYDIGDFIRAHDLTKAVGMTMIIPTRILPQRVLRDADTLGTAIFEQLNHTYNDTMGLLSYVSGKLLPSMVLLEFNFGGPVSLVGFAIVAFGLQLHGADPRMQQLVVRLPSNERYLDKPTQGGQGFPTQVRFVEKSHFVHHAQFKMEFNPLMQWVKSERVEWEMIENTHPIERILTTADVERYLQFLFKRKLYGASTAAESVGQFERPLVAEAYDITDNGRAKSTSPGDETHLGYAALNQVERLEERLRGASIREDTFVKCTVLTDESIHLATKLCSDLLPRKLWATLMGPVLPLSSNVVVSVMDAWLPYCTANADATERICPHATGRISHSQRGIISITAASLSPVNLKRPHSKQRAAGAAWVKRKNAAT